MCRASAERRVGGRTGGFYGTGQATCAKRGSSHRHVATVPRRFARTRSIACSASGDCRPQIRKSRMQAATSRRYESMAGPARSLYRHTATASLRSQASRRSRTPRTGLSLRPFHHEIAWGGRARLHHTGEQRKDRDREAEPAQGHVPALAPNHAPPGGRRKPIQRGRSRAGPETKGVARTLARGRPRAPQGRPWAVCACTAVRRALTALDAPRWPSRGTGP